MPNEQFTVKAVFQAEDQASATIRQLDGQFEELNRDVNKLSASNARLSATNTAVATTTTAETAATTRATAATTARTQANRALTFSLRAVRSAGLGLSVIVGTLITGLATLAVSMLKNNEAAVELGGAFKRLGSNIAETITQTETWRALARDTANVMDAFTTVVNSAADGVGGFAGQMRRRLADFKLFNLAMADLADGINAAKTAADGLAATQLEESLNGALDVARKLGVSFGQDVTDKVNGLNDALDLLRIAQEGGVISTEEFRNARERINAEIETARNGTDGLTESQQRNTEATVAQTGALALYNIETGQAIENTIRFTEAQLAAIDAGGSGAELGLNQAQTRRLRLGRRPGIGGRIGAQGRFTNFNIADGTFTDDRGVRGG